jgi:hypothetical protein
VRRSFVRGAKPTSPGALCAQRAEREQRGEGVLRAGAEGTGRHRRSCAYRRAAAVPLPRTGPGRVTFLEVGERRADGTVGYPNSWVTDFVVPPETVAAIGGVGRSRWQIENEQFNVPKHHGDEVEPNSGHGQQTLARVFYLLNLLAFLAPTLLEFGDRLSHQCRAGESRRGVWTLFRSTCSLIELATWAARRRSHLRESAAGP